MRVDAKKHLLSYAVAMIVVGCGGGGKDDNDSPDLGSEVSEQEYAASLTDGLYKVEADMQFRGSITIEGVTVDNAWETDGVSHGIISNRTAISCDAGPDESLDDDSELGLCEDKSEESRKYFVDGNTFSVVSSCPGEYEMIFKVSKLSNDTVFDVGSLNFTSDNHAPLNLTQDVCGGLVSSKVEQVVPPEFNDYGIESGIFYGQTVEVGAPYGTSNVLLSFYFVDLPSSGLATGTYQVRDNLNVDISSFEFGNVNGFPEKISAQSGTVTITFVGPDAVSGTFDITGHDGSILDTSTFQGAFTVDLK